MRLVVLSAILGLAASGVVYAQPGVQPASRLRSLASVLTYPGRIRVRKRTPSSSARQAQVVPTLKSITL